jgi:hypothetical protein
MSTLTHTQLLSLAARHPAGSQTDAARILRDAGHQQAGNVLPLLDATRQLTELRSRKRMGRRWSHDRTPAGCCVRYVGGTYRLRQGECDMVPDHHRTHPANGLRALIDPMLCSGPTPAERKARLTEVLAAGELLKYKLGTHGSSHVVLVSGGESVCGVEQSVSLSRYSRSCIYSKKSVQTTLFLPSDWFSRVYRRNLHRLDGLMTLWAQPVDAVGCEAFAATWLEQARGTSLRVVRGYIARAADGTSYHGNTLTAALTGLRRKTKLAEIDRLPTEQMVALAARHTSARVTVADARAVGACEAGIRSWVARTDIALTDDATTLGDLLSAYLSVPATEARAVILRCLRRCRALAA